MKNIQSIISNLRRDSLKRLNSNAIINKLLLTLPKDLQKSILFGTLKGDTLFIATTNKSICTEINNFRVPDLLNAINFILDSSLLANKATEAIHESKMDYLIIEREQNLEILRKIKKIKAYIPRNRLKQEEQNKYKRKADIIIIEHYKERATGKFHISKNSPLKEIFGAIKDAIKRNNNEAKR